RGALLMIWTVRQRSGLAIIGLVLAALFLYRGLTNSQNVPSPQPPVGARAGELPQSIDPNTADAATLAAIPGVGKPLAERIVAYREKWLKAGRPGVAFSSDEDLKN